MTRKAKKKSKALKVEGRAVKITKHAAAKKEKADNINKTTKHSVAESLASSMEHMPYNLGYLF